MPLITTTGSPRLLELQRQERDRKRAGKARKKEKSEQKKALVGDIVAGVAGGILDKPTPAFIQNEGRAIPAVGVTGFAPQGELGPAVGPPQAGAPPVSEEERQRLLFQLLLERGVV
jgi:hypothetical protein